MNLLERFRTGYKMTHGEKEIQRLRFECWKPIILIGLPDQTGETSEAKQEAQMKLVMEEMQQQRLANEERLALLNNKIRTRTWTGRVRDGFKRVLGR